MNPNPTPKPADPAPKPVVYNANVYEAVKFLLTEQLKHNDGGKVLQAKALLDDIQVESGEKKSPEVLKAEADAEAKHTLEAEHKKAAELKAHPVPVAPTVSATGPVKTT